ncbi:MAG: hypothetical protein WCG21_13010 [Eubacteriales bacterium]
MEIFYSVADLIRRVETSDAAVHPDYRVCRKIICENSDTFLMLAFLEKTNPCSQKYYLYKKVIIVSYVNKVEIFHFPGKHSLKRRLNIIGLPLSLSNSGYFIDSKDEETAANLAGILKEFANMMKGTTILINADRDVWRGCLAAATFVFHNRFSSFQEYLDAMRSSYRKKAVTILKKGQGLNFTRVEKGGFTEEHYSLYLSVNRRTVKKLLTMPFEFFRDSDAVVFEIRDRDNRLLAFVQLKELEGDLYFVLCGFEKTDSLPKNSGQLHHIDLYFNLLYFIVRYGIENGYRNIIFGQTSGESKSKVGCVEELKYIYATSSNPLIKAYFRMFPGVYSVRPYNVTHNVFRDDP